MKSTAKANWAGSMTEGEGRISAGTGLFKDANFSVKGRFEGGVPGTTPEELLAGALAGCFTMALGVGLMQSGLTAKSIDTSADVEVVLGDKGADITFAALRCAVEVPGADAKKVRAIAEDAKTGCPVSKALAGVKITLDLDVKV